MNTKFLQFLTLGATAATLLAVCAGCHTTSIKTTWKSPDYAGGPVQKVALVAVADRGLVRGGFENRLAGELKKTGQAALTTYETLSLEEIKANKEGTVTNLRQAGADCVMILRMVDSTTRFAEVRQSPGLFVPVTTGMYYDGWYDYYSVAYVDLSVIRGSTRQDIVMDTSLFDLKTGKRLWSCVTGTVIKDDVDKLKLADAFVAKVVAALRKDGLVR
jgi:hypothetical protein